MSAVEWTGNLMRRGGACLWLTLALSCSIPVEAFAQDLMAGWKSVRALGMGNAYISVVDDADSLFYNPAGLAGVSGVHWTIFDVHGGVNGVEAIQNVMKLQDAGEDVAATLQDLYGKRTWAGARAKTAIVVPHFGIAGFIDTEAGFYATNPANTTMRLNYYFDYGVVMGTGFDLIPGIFKLGVSAKRINRTGTTLPTGAATLATLDPEALQSELKRRGTGYGLDVGAVLTLPGPVKPSLALVYRNLGQTTFTFDEGAGSPPPIPQQMIIGGSLTVDALLVSVTPSIDYAWADRPDIQLGNKIHLGVEVDLPLLALRAGFNQGYYTAGASVDIGPITVDAATYGVELGEYPGQKEDRRYMVEATFELGIGFDLFGFGGGSSGDGKSGGGSKRRVKQRR